MVIFLQFDLDYLENSGVSIFGGRQREEAELLVQLYIWIYYTYKNSFIIYF